MLRYIPLTKLICGRCIHDLNVYVSLFSTAGPDDMYSSSSHCYNNILYLWSSNFSHQWLHFVTILQICSCIASARIWRIAEVIDATDLATINLGFFEYTSSCHVLGNKIKTRRHPSHVCNTHVCVLLSKRSRTS